MTRLRRMVSVAIFGELVSCRMLVACAAFAGYVIVGPHQYLYRWAEYYMLYLNK